MSDDASQAQDDGEEQDEHQLIQFRRKKLDTLRELGVDPFGGKFDTTHQPGALRDAFEEGLQVRIAGRITALRDMGNSQFLDLSDFDGRIQLFVNKKAVGEEQWAIYKCLDIGDWIGVEGETFVTRTEEPSVKVAHLTVLSKTLRPLADKWHGLADPQIKYRQRYLDLIANERSRDIFRKRIDMVAEIRAFMREREFREVETPMLQDVPGGAAAQPFETHHNALSMALFLRIAPELYLKRLLVAGFPKVFELNRSFRNEGISRRHNPEFTMLEAYWAYADFELMADLMEEMICHLAEKFCGSLQVEHKQRRGRSRSGPSTSARPWKRAPLPKISSSAKSPVTRLVRALFRSNGHRTSCHEELHVEISPTRWPTTRVTHQVFEKLVEEKTVDPLLRHPGALPRNSSPSPSRTSPMTPPSSTSTSSS